jgi:energy-converting hydrogenase Eha subunit F
MENAFTSSDTSKKSSGSKGIDKKGFGSTVVGNTGGALDSILEETSGL